MPDPPDVADWSLLDPWLDQVGLRGARPVRQVTDEHGAYSPAGRWVVELPDGSTRFVKAMRARSLAAGDPGLEREHLAVTTVPDGMAPAAYGWLRGDASEGRPSILVLEDPSGAAWGAPISPVHVAGLRHVLDQLAMQAPDEVPDQLPSIDRMDPWPDGGWAPVLASPGTLAVHGIVTTAWLDAHGDALLDAVATIDAAGAGFVHGDLWRQNWCGVDNRAMLVDWTGARRGNPRLNHAWGECGVRAAGGAPGIVLRADELDHAGLAAWMSGLACSFLALDEFDRTRHHRLHQTQVREAVAAIRWVCEALELPLPTELPALADLGVWRP